MLTTYRKLPPFFLLPITFFLILLLALPWVNAKELPKPKPQPWQIDGIVAALNDPYPKVKASAFDQLASYESQDLKTVVKEPEDIARKAADIIKNEKVEASVRSSAAKALGNLGQAAQPHIKDIADILKDEQVDGWVRSSAALALENLGQAAQPYIKDILDFLKDEEVNPEFRYGVAQTLGNLGQAAQPYIKDILDFLKDEKVDAFVRRRAAEALGNLGQAAQPYAKDIADFLKDEKVNAYVRGSAAVALGNLGQAAQPYIKDILNLLKDEKVNAQVRSNAAQALSNIRKLELNEVVVILDRIYEPNQQYINFEQWRFLTYFLSGGADEVKTLLKWLGYPQALPTQLNYEEAKKTLELFRDTWAVSQDLKRLQEDLAKQIAEVTRRVSWKPQDILLLQTHYNNLKNARYNQADTIQAVINNLELWKWLFTTKNIILIHVTFWLALIFAYPKFPQVQAIFFWNPWVRKILGVGYVGFLLTWVPFLRRKLFEPFKPSLVADAGLDNFDDNAYFPESIVKLPTSEETVEVTKALPSIKGRELITPLTKGGLRGVLPT